VLCVIAHDSEGDAIRIANDSWYGLHSAVLGTDLQRLRRVVHAGLTHSSSVA